MRSTSALLTLVRWPNALLAGGGVVLGAWWAGAVPVNALVAQHTPQMLPPDWAQLRLQWEYTHAMRFVLQAALQAGAALKATPDRVDAVPSSAFPTPARRPLNSRLDTSHLQATFGLRMPPWQAGVARMLDEVLPTRS